MQVCRLLHILSLCHGMHILHRMKPLLLQTPTQLASHLRSLRKTRDLTQTELGKLVGLDQTRIAKIERDPRRINVELLLRVFAALQVRVLLQPIDEKSAALTRGGSTDW